MVDKVQGGPYSCVYGPTEDHQDPIIIVVIYASSLMIKTLRTGTHQLDKMAIFICQKLSNGKKYMVVINGSL